MLPNLIVIGSSRCGTTSLYEYVRLHPEVSMSRTKELNFFVEERNWSRGVDWYERQFPEARPVRGEASPHYTAYPRYAGVPERMAALVPAAKLVYLVRDPIARAVSAYSLTRAMGLETQGPQAILADFRDGFYLAEGRYWMQLERYLEHFPREQILVVDQHELLRNRRETLARVFRFLDVDHAFQSPAFAREHHPTPARRRTRLGFALVPLLDRLLGEDRSRMLRAKAPRLVRAPLVSVRRDASVILDQDLRDQLESYFSEDVAKLRSFTGQRFASWSV